MADTALRPIYRIVAQHRRGRARFSPANFLEPPRSYPKLDLVVLRTVLTYFVRETKTSALTQVLRQLQCHDAVFALGATESISGNWVFKPVDFGQLCCYTHA